jgi:hypothetical protein
MKTIISKRDESPGKKSQPESLENQAETKSMSKRGMNPDTIFDKIQNKIVDNAMMCRV